MKKIAEVTKKFFCLEKEIAESFFISVLEDDFEAKKIAKFFLEFLERNKNY